MLKKYKQNYEKKPCIFVDKKTKKICSNIKIQFFQMGFLFFFSNTKYIWNLKSMHAIKFDRHKNQINQNKTQNVICVNLSKLTQTTKGE